MNTFSEGILSELPGFINSILFHLEAPVLCLPTVAGGKTNICAGICKGLKLIAEKTTTTYGSEIVLLTDGEDRHMAVCLDLVKQSGAKIHTIALGPDAAKELEEFSKLTGFKIVSLDTTSRSSTTASQGADTIKDDGIFSRYFTSLQGTGRYSVKVHAHGKNITTRLGSRQNRALYLPGYKENGKIYINAPRPKFTDRVQAKLGSFSRISTSSLVVNTREDSAPVYPPCKITDLHARIENNTIVLSGTAPGGDFDNGKADRYIIKSSENLLDLRNHFDHATSVNCSNLIPKEAGREEFKIKTENFVIEIDTIIYFTIRAVDHTKLISEVSNIAQVTWFIPPKASVPLNHDNNNDSTNSTVTAVPLNYDGNNDSANSTVIVVPLNYDGNNDSANGTVTVSIAALCVAVVCTIVISTLYVLQKQKGRLDIETMQKLV
ncbi:LOW QUALITY PROTEIN: calcium-activated chloride channel regulator 1-like [Alca torda]